MHDPFADSHTKSDDCTDQSLSAVHNQMNSFD